MALCTSNAATRRYLYSNIYIFQKLRNKRINKKITIVENFKDKKLYLAVDVISDYSNS